MRSALSWLLLGSTLLLGAVGAGAVPPSAEPGPVPASAADQELQFLLEKLSALSEVIGRKSPPPEVWRYQMQQGEVMLQIAARSKAEEHEKWLRLAIDAHFGAAIMSPGTELTAYQRLVQLPDQIANSFPGNPLYSYAAMQEIQADYTRTLNKEGGDLPKAQGHFCDRLARFAQDYPAAPEAPKTLMDAGQLYESLGKIDKARQCYRYLVEHFAKDALARKAQGAMWRLGMAGERVRLDLPLLYAGQPNEPPFALEQLNCKLAVVYFWASSTPQCADDLQTLKQLAERYQKYGLEVVYVNVDSDPATARAFLSGRLTAGVHLSDRAGMEGGLAERCGIQSLPHLFLLGKDGTLLKHSLQVAELEAELASHLPRDR